MTKALDYLPLAAACLGLLFFAISQQDPRFLMGLFFAYLFLVPDKQ